MPDKRELTDDEKAKIDAAFDSMNQGESALLAQTLGVGILKDTEKERIAMMFLWGQAKAGIESTPGPEIDKVIEWCERARLDHGFLENILCGSMMPVLDEAGEVAFALTPKGESEVNDMLVAVLKEKGS